MKNSSLLKFYIFLFVAAVFIYANTFKHEFVLDDAIVFTENSFVQQGITAFPQIISHGFLYGYNKKNDQSYRPLVLIELALGKSLFGNNPSAQHILNVLYYAIVCCLLFYFLNTLFINNRPWLVLWMSLLFLLHPIHTEVVANIKGREELLQSLFLLLSFIYALKYVDYTHHRDLWLSVITFFLALLCKEMAITYLALLPLTLWVFRKIEIKAILILLVPYAGVLLFYFFLRHWVLDTLTFEESMSVLNNSLAAAENYPERWATTLLIFSKYIILLVFPHPLTWDYSYPYFEMVDFTNLKVIITSVVLVALTILSFYKVRSKNVFAYTLLFFLISFSIVSNFFILIGSTLGERFLFFPSIAFCVFLVLLIKKLMYNEFLATRLFPTMLFIIATLYAIKTYDRNKDWKNNTTLFTAGVEVTPNNTRAQSAMAGVFRELAEQSIKADIKQFYYNKAIRAYQKSIELLPTNADSYYNLGVIYLNTQRLNLAKYNFIKAIEIQPDNINALNNLGVIYFNNQIFNKALEYFTASLKVDPEFSKAYANIGAVYHNLGDIENARQYYLKALHFDPEDRNTILNLKNLNN